MTSKPYPFKQGSTFSFAMAIPEDIDDGALANWIPTAQLRRDRNNGPQGLIADINVYWDDPVTARILIIHHNVTKDWPVGLAELDILFTSASGQTIRSTTVIFDIQRSITK